MERPQTYQRIGDDGTPYDIPLALATDAEIEMMRSEGRALMEAATLEIVRRRDRRRLAHTIKHGIERHQSKGSPQ